MLENVDKDSQRKINEVDNVSNSKTYNKLPPETAHHTSIANRNKLVSNTKPQGKGPNKARPIEKVEKQKISHRPSSSSGTRKAVPVHLNAPFQTNPNLISSKLQTTYKAATAKTLAKSRSAGSASGRGREIKGTEKAQSVASRLKSIKTDVGKVKQTDIPEVNRQEDSNVKLDTDICHVAENSVSNNSTDDVDTLKEKLTATSIKNDQDSSAGKQSQDNEDKDCDELFYLKKDG